eukprot:Opistho-2@23563
MASNAEGEPVYDDDDDGIDEDYGMSDEDDGIRGRAFSTASKQARFHKSTDSLDIDGTDDPDVLKERMKELKSERVKLKEEYHNQKKVRDEELRLKKKEYRKEKRMRQEHILTNLTDDSANIISGWLKFRGALKQWTKYWAILRPGVLMYFRDDKKLEWSGSIILNGCEAIQRPTSKEGFCFKIFHPLEHSIYATRGPRGELLPTVFAPISADHCIVRTGEQEGKAWLSAIQKAAHLTDRDSEEDGVSHASHEYENGADGNSPLLAPQVAADNVPAIVGTTPMIVTPSGDSVQGKPTNYIPKVQGDLEIPQGLQTEEWGEESKNLILTLLKQVRPGMDLSRVVLPTFILEPRSFLDKLSDYYYHVDTLAQAAKQTDPLKRIIGIVRWYLSGFYNRPKGCKKPYNPIIGETYRCAFKHPTGSVTYFVAEQVSHHPPVSAWYASNRAEGYGINGVLLTRSKFYGTSAASILEGQATLSLNNFDEEYILTFPTAQVKGIILGPLIMEMAGHVSITCPKTNYTAEIEFRAKPMIGGEYNTLRGKIRCGKETIFNIQGAYDGQIEIVNAQTKDVETLWSVTNDTKKRRLEKMTVPMDLQGPKESEKLWIKVTEAIDKGDQVAATNEKGNLEDDQRQIHRELKAAERQWEPRLFVTGNAGQWVYKYPNTSPWQPDVDIEEVEVNGIIATKRQVTVSASGAPASAAASSSQHHAVTKQIASVQSDATRMKRAGSHSNVNIAVNAATASHAHVSPSPMKLLTGKPRADSQSKLEAPGASKSAGHSPSLASASIGDASDLGKSVKELRRTVQDLNAWQRETNRWLEGSLRQIARESNANAPKRDRKGLAFNLLLLLVLLLIQAYVQLRMYGYITDDSVSAVVDFVLEPFHMLK